MLSVYCSSCIQNHEYEHEGLWFASFPLFLSIQVINGLMDREDWEQAIRTPLGILPGGSGNALAASVHHYSQ